MSDKAMCAGCRERFHTDLRYVKYGGLNWCTVECLAEWTVENDKDDEFIDKVEEEMEVSVHGE